MIAMTLDDLPALNAVLNGVATTLLVAGYALIKRGHRVAHRNIMLAAIGTSAVFLASYLTYHFNAEAMTPFRGPGSVKRVYLIVLFTHVVLAALVPFLALRTAYLGLRGRFSTHRRLARITFPIWLYVSVTGVLIYLVLYQMFPADLR
jgi:uncharacterized membrane protein YozB (DUF420 family)